MVLKHLKILNKLSTISFVLMIYSGLVKWINIWPIDPTILFSAILSICLLLSFLSKMKIKLVKNGLRYFNLIFPFTIWFFISIFYSPSELYVYTKAINYVLIVLSFCVPFLIIKNKKELIFFIYVMASFGLIISFIFTYLYILGGQNIYSTYFKLLQNGNPLGIPDYLALATPVGITAIVLFFNKNKYLKILSLFPIFTLLILSGRAPVLAFVLVVLIYVFFNIKLTKKHIRNAIAIVLIAMFSFTQISKINFYERLASRFNVMLEGDTKDNKSLTVRYELYNKSYQMFSSNPVFGIGLGAYGLYRVGKDGRDHPHNMFLEVLIEQGIIGLILLLIIFSPLLLKVYPKLIKSKDSTYFICGAIFIYESINVIKSSSIVENRPYFSIIGICFVAYLLLNTNKKSHIINEQ